MKNNSTYDCIIIGGGVAGLTAGMILARARRNVLIIDAGKQSNKASRLTHGLFAKDAIEPTEVYNLGRQQFETYPSTEYKSAVVKKVDRNGLFEVILESNEVYSARSVLLAQGNEYKLPDIKGIEDLWGNKAWHCPYCDGFEARDKRILAIGSVQWIDHMSIILPNWSDQLFWASIDQEIPEYICSRIKNSGGQIIKDIKEIKSNNDTLTVIFSEDNLEIDEILTATKTENRDDIAHKLMCKFESTGEIFVDEYGRTSVAGVYACGDAANSLQQANIAIASGHKAALGINLDLSQAEREAEVKP